MKLISQGGSSIAGAVCLGRNVLPPDRAPVYCVQCGKTAADNPGNSICIP
jgi:hypothetical protein